MFAPRYWFDPRTKKGAQQNRVLTVRSWIT